MDPWVPRTIVTTGFSALAGAIWVSRKAPVWKAHLRVAGAPPMSTEVVSMTMELGCRRTKV